METVSDFKDICKYIENFINKVSLTYPEASFDSLDDIDYTYKLFNNCKVDSEKYKLLKSLFIKVKICEFRYGGEYDILSKIPEYSHLINSFNNLNKTNDDNLKKEILSSIDKEKISVIGNVKLINNNLQPQLNERLDDILNSIQKIFENTTSRKVLSNEDLYKLLLNYHAILINQNEKAISKSEESLKEINNKIWKHGLSNYSDFVNGKNFRFLIHNFNAGESFEDHISKMRDYRNGRISASLVSNDFMGVYGLLRRCGFINPPDSDIITSGKKDLYTVESKVHQITKNKEYASSLISLPFLIDEGKKLTQESGEEFDYSSKYNEVVLDSKDTKPCALYIIGYGEKDINVDYKQLKEIAKNLNLPVIEIDMSIYRTKMGLESLGENAKKYIAIHTVYSYFDLNLDGSNNVDFQNMSKFEQLSELLKEDICKEFLKLKNNNQISSDNMKIVFRNLLNRYNVDEKLYYNLIGNDIIKH